MNTLKWTIVFSLIVIGVIGNSHFSESSILIRVISLLGLAMLAVAIALNTKRGSQFLSFVKESQAELRRVVWPTRPEIMQMTMIVLVMVSVLGVVLWVVDTILLRAIGWLTGFGA